MLGRKTGQEFGARFRKDGARKSNDVGEAARLLGAEPAKGNASSKPSNQHGNAPAVNTLFPTNSTPMMTRSVAPIGQKLAPLDKTHVENVYMMDRRFIAMGENIGRGKRNDYDAILERRADIKARQNEGTGIDGCGIMQPLGVRPLPAGRRVTEVINGERIEKTHELVWGYKRFFATEVMPGDAWSMPFVPVVVQNLSNAEAAAAAIAENMQRSEPSPAQLGQAIVALREAMQADMDALCEQFQITFDRPVARWKKAIAGETTSRIKTAIEEALASQSDGTRAWMQLIFERALKRWKAPRVVYEDTLLVLGGSKRALWYYLNAAKVVKEIDDEVEGAENLTGRQLRAIGASQGADKEANAAQQARTARAATLKEFPGPDLEFFASLPEAVQNAILEAGNFRAHHLDALRLLDGEVVQRNLVREIERRQLTLGAAMERAKELRGEMANVNSGSMESTAPARPFAPSANNAPRWGGSPVASRTYESGVFVDTAGGSTSTGAANIEDVLRLASVLRSRLDEVQTLAQSLGAQASNLSEEAKASERFQQDVVAAAHHFQEQLEGVRNLLQPLTPLVDAEMVEASG